MDKNGTEMCMKAGSTLDETLTSAGWIGWDEQDISEQLDYQEHLTVQKYTGLDEGGLCEQTEAKKPGNSAIHFNL